MAPVSNKFVLKIIVIVVESISDVQSLRRGIIHSEVVGLAVTDKRVAILIFSIAIVSQDGFAKSKLVV